MNRVNSTLNPNARPILANVALFRRGLVRLAGEDGLEIRFFGVEIGGMSHVLIFELEQLRGSVAQDFTELTVDAEKPSLGTQMGDADCGGFEGGAIEFLALAKRLLNRSAALKNLFSIQGPGAVLGSGDRGVEEGLMAADCFERPNQIAGDGGFD